MRKIIIGVMGGAVCDEETAKTAFQVGQLIADRGAALLCGGGRGVMKAASAGAKSRQGLVIGIMPGSDAAESPPNEFIDIPIFTGMSDCRNAINAKSSDVLIAIDGECGTLSEIALALKNNKTVIGLKSWDISQNGNTPLNYIKVDSAEEAVAKAFACLML